MKILVILDVVSAIPRQDHKLDAGEIREHSSQRDLLLKRSIIRGTHVINGNSQQARHSVRERMLHVSGEHKTVADHGDPGLLRQ